jgi:hypothetical protein
LSCVILSPSFHPQYQLEAAVNLLIAMRLVLMKDTDITSIFEFY